MSDAMGLFRLRLLTGLITLSTRLLDAANQQSVSERRTAAQQYIAAHMASHHGACLKTVCSAVGHSKDEDLGDSVSGWNLCRVHRR